MHKSRLAALVIDCESGDLDEHARFWAEALGYSVKDRAADNEGKYVALSGPASELSVILQKVEHPSRVHLDIESDDAAAEVRRLEQLGARQVATIKDWVVLEAPSGHRFCVVKPQRADFADRATEWPTSSS
jgi:predicted enzyme related to lactoylglutathione lyase